MLYGNGEGPGGRPPHPGAHGQGGGSEDVAAGDVGAWEHHRGGGGGSDKQKLRELDLQGNKRPVSRNSTSRKVPNFEKGQ